MGQRDGDAALVLAVRREFCRLAGDVRDGGQAVPAGTCGKHGRWQGRWTRPRARACRRCSKRYGGSEWPDGLGRIYVAGEIAERRTKNENRKTRANARVFLFVQSCLKMPRSPLISSDVITPEYRLSVR